MKTKLILAALLTTVVTTRAITIIPTIPYTGFHTDITLPLTGFDGTPLAGQHLDIEIVFPAGTFIRLFPSTSLFVSLFQLLTDTPPVNFTAGTGAFLDSNLNTLLEVPIGQVNSSNGFLGAGLVLPTVQLVPLLDIYGLRYTLDLPVEPVTVVGCELRLAGVGPFIVAPYETPDSGDAITLLAIGLAGALCLSHKLNPKI